MKFTHFDRKKIVHLRSRSTDVPKLALRDTARYQIQRDIFRKSTVNYSLFIIATSLRPFWKGIDHGNIEI